MNHVSEIRDSRLLLEQLQKQSAQVSYEHLAWPYVFAIPLLFLTGLYVQIKKKLLPEDIETNVWFVDGISINSRRVKEGAAKMGALDAVYNFSGGEGLSAFARRADCWWLHVRNAQAVRNRLQIVETELSKAILRQHEALGRRRPVRLLSLAAGSAQGVLKEVVALEHRGVKVEVMLVDWDREAVAHIKERVQLLGITDSVTVVRGLVQNFSKRAKVFQPDIIEMCGYMDYLEADEATKLSRDIFEALPTDGTYLTCHVHPNLEAYFLEHVVNWRMLYKRLPVFKAILRNAGFGKVRYVTEPHRIHTVAVAEKS